MRKTSKLLFGAIIVGILLAIYIYSMGSLIIAVINNANSGLSNLDASDISDEFLMVLTTVSGLVSALVISELTFTKIAGETSATKLLEEGASIFKKSAAHYLTYLYIWIWIVIGAGSFVVGVMLYPEMNSTLKDAGTTWFGLIVAIGYSYFGIQPK